MLAASTDFHKKTPFSLVGLFGVFFKIEVFKLKKSSNVDIKGEETFRKNGKTDIKVSLDFARTQ